MAEFWRLYNNKLYRLYDTSELGFPEADPSYIPDEYLSSKNFVLFRTCHAIGDWAILSAMPRLLKRKYPDCKVHLPSEKLLESIFEMYRHQWGSWSNPFSNVTKVFENNPYIDDYVDSVEGDVFHDHYRIYPKNKNIPLIKQMLKFWQFKDNEMNDCQPELYFSEKEKELGDKIINEHSSGKIGTILLSDRFDYSPKKIEKIQNLINENDFEYFYWTSIPNTGLNFKKALDMRHIDIRVQWYIKTKSNINIGNQTGVNDMIARYAPTYTIPHGELESSLGGNVIEDQNYI